VQIDWITVLAQIANFLVLVWLLRRLLYGPITRAMEERENSIRERFWDAEQREAAAESERERLQSELEILNDRRDQLLVDAQEQARRLRHDLESEARDEVEEKRQMWRVQLRKEESAFLQELRKNATSHVERVARRALSDFADLELEEAMADTFISQLKKLDAKALRALRSEAKTAMGKISLDSAFVLGPTIRAKLTRAIHEVIHAEAGIEYQCDPDLICGIRLTVRGQTIQWSMAAYLDDLEEETKGLFEDVGGGDRPGGSADRKVAE